MSKIIGAREFQTKNPDELSDTAESLGPNHDPMPHRESALVVLEGLRRLDLEVLDQEFVVDGVRSLNGRGGNYGAITIPGANLFAMFTIRNPFADTGDEDPLIFAYRNSIAQALARQGCVGKGFTVCTNISMFGTNFVFKQKNTPGNTAAGLIAEMTDRVRPMLESVEQQLDRLRNTDVLRLDTEVVDLFERNSLPVKYFQPLAEVVHTARNEAGSISPDAYTYPEVSENTFNQLGVMHAATRVIQDVPTRRQANLSQAIGAHFNYGTSLLAA